MPTGLYTPSSPSSSGTSRRETLGQLGRYTLLHKLAIGGMAEIYLAKTSGIEGFEKIDASRSCRLQRA